MRLRRAFLYTPGEDEHKIEKACALRADCVCLDLEDAVSPSKKEDARITVAHAIGAFEFGKSERLERVNAPSSPYFMADLRTVIHAVPDGIVIPKVEEASTLQEADGFLEAFEAFWAHGLQAGTIDDDRRVVSRMDVERWIDTRSGGGNFLFTREL
jgi:citrate lyase subunit beta/citryl-CoA lyase